MKKLVFLSLFMAFASLSNAQLSNVEFGLRGAVNLSRPNDFKGYDSIDPDLSTKFSPGFGFGAYFESKFTNVVVRTELLFSKEISKYSIEYLVESRKGRTTVTIDATESINKIKVPILVGGFIVGNQLGVYAGVTTGFNLSDTGTLVSNGKTTEVDDVFAVTSFSFPIGLYFVLNEKMKIDLRYNVGLTKSSREDDEKTYHDTDLIELSLLYQLKKLTL